MANGKVHRLKTWPNFYKSVREKDSRKRKTLEIRKDDRGYDTGDLLILEEFDPETQKYTGESCWVLVTHCLRGLPWVPEGYVAMSISETSSKEEE